MEQVRATRAELLAKKNQITLARRGCDLLKEKRNALMKELMRAAELTLRGGDELELSAAEAIRALALADALDGPEAVRSASFASRGQVTLEVMGTNIMGVPVPVIGETKVERGLLDRGYSLSSVSSRIDAAASAFETETNMIIELASTEMRLRRLAAEIGRTTRRVNALDNVLIPRLHREWESVALMLEEREREDLFRLKRVKMKLERRSQRGTSGS